MVHLSLTFLLLLGGSLLVRLRIIHAMTTMVLCLTCNAEDSVALIGPEHEFTKLIISHKGVDPEDAFSSVPYEKGFHFLYYLDNLVGREHFDKFIPHYFQTWARKSLDSFEFKQTFMDFFGSYGNPEIVEKIAKIPWEERFYTPGLPPKPEFDTSYVDSCMGLAEQWKDKVRIIP